MIKIIIKQYSTEEYTETVNYIVKKSPTEIVEAEENSYGGRTTKKVQHIEEYAASPTKKTRTIERKLLKQEIVDESKFDLAAVIKALNGL